MFQNLKSRVGGTPARDGKAVDPIDELRAELKAMRELLKSVKDDAAKARLSSTTSAKTVEELTAEVRTLREELSLVRVREAQLRAIAQADIAFSEEERLLDAVFEDPTVKPHVTAAVLSAPLKIQPFPYAVVDNLLPKAVYRSLIRALPPPELFADQPKNKQQIKVPLEFASSYTRQVWRFVADTIAEQFIQPAVLQLFHEAVSDWLRRNFPHLAEPPDAHITMNCSGGRIMRRERGYRIPPHRDPKWGFITCLMYLARKGDDERWGTQVYSVDDDREAQGAAPHWIDPARCRLVEDVAFKRNRALIFLNSSGAHGASIPEDAEPADLDRYAYQFRIGPDAASIAAITSTLPEERRAAWTGKLSDY